MIDERRAVAAMAPLADVFERERSLRRAAQPDDPVITAHP
jgi:hypothetical protein